MHSLAVALRGKGVRKLVERSTRIVSRYGLTVDRLAHELQLFATLAGEFQARPSFPITTVVLARHLNLIRRWHAAGVEFAIHGYRHVDYSTLPVEHQITHVRAAQAAFAQAGLTARGFRAPYLRFNPVTLGAIQGQGLSYDASPALAWPVSNGRNTPAYQRVLEFFGARSTNEQPAVPWIEDDLVRIPYSLPDDESLIERLGMTTSEAMSGLWLGVLQLSHARGELFTLGLHPERTSLCLEALRAVLAAASAMRPTVWLARLDEIADWWRERRVAQLNVWADGAGSFRVHYSGPIGTTLLMRGATARIATLPWADGYARVTASPGESFNIESIHSPLLGLAPDTAPAAVEFLRQQGYVVEINPRPQTGVYLQGLRDFADEDRLPLLARIEASDGPLLRFGRWPNGTRSALALTGDIDALTIWDYGLRFIGG